MKHKLLLPLLATVFTMGYHKVKSQDNEGDRKVRIEITTNENGKTEHVTREFDLSDGEALEDALRELGVFDQIGVINNGENLVIDLKRTGEDGGALRDMSMAMAMEDAGEPGAQLGVYCSNWCSTECEDGKDKGAKNGARITGVIEGSGAEAAGLMKGDVITAIGGSDVEDFNDLVEAVDAHQPGESVEVAYWRDGKKDKVKATLGEEKAEPFSFNFSMPQMSWSDMADNFTPEQRGFLGVDGEDVEKNGGVRIIQVIEGSSAEAMGLLEGDVIKKLNGTAIMGFDALAEVVGELDPASPVILEVERSGATTTVEGALGEQDPTEWGIPELPEMPEMPQAPDAYRMDRRAQSEAMRSEVDQLRREMEQLRRELRGDVRSEMRVVVATIQLDPAERDVLKNKGVTGLDPSWQLPDLRCFPNPSNGDFHLEFSAPERGDLAVDLHNAAGERVYHETITGFKGRYERMLDLSDQNDGTYFLVISQNGKALARKLVKQ